jgi:pyruvate/2-oxoglutarate dehydrogenase complex dihydrolipoamide acyltransferase (E2) component
MRQTIARRLKNAQNTAACLTTFNEIDMHNIMALRTKYKDEFAKKHGVKLGFMSAFVKVLHYLPPTITSITTTTTTDFHEITISLLRHPHTRW